MRSVSILFRRYPLAWWACLAIVATAAGYLVFSSVASSVAASERLGGMQTVTVTVRPVAAGTEVQPADVASVEWPKALLPQAALVSQPTGRTTAVAIASGTPVTDNLLAGSGSGRAAALLHPNERGFTVPRDQFTPDVVVGDWVDLYAASTPADERPESTMVGAGFRVVDVSEGGVTLAVPADDAAAVAGATARRLTLSVSRPPLLAAEGHSVDSDGDAGR